MIVEFYACGTCASPIMVITPKLKGWKIACGNGHVVVPVPGTEFVATQSEIGGVEQ